MDQNALLTTAIVGVVLGGIGLIGGVLGYVQSTAAVRRSTHARQRAVAAEEEALRAKAAAEATLRSVEELVERLRGPSARLQTGPVGTGRYAGGAPGRWDAQPPSGQGSADQGRTGQGVASPGSPTGRFTGPVVTPMAEPTTGSMLLPDTGPTSLQAPAAVRPAAQAWRPVSEPIPEQPSRPAPEREAGPQARPEPAVPVAEDGPEGLPPSAVTDGDQAGPPDDGTEIRPDSEDARATPGDPAAAAAALPEQAAAGEPEPESVPDPSLGLGEESDADDSLREGSGDPDVEREAPAADPAAPAADPVRLDEHQGSDQETPPVDRSEPDTSEQDESGSAAEGSPSVEEMPAAEAPHPDPEKTEQAVEEEPQDGRDATGRVTVGAQDAPTMDWAEVLRTGAIPLPSISRGTYAAPRRRPRPTGQGPARFELRTIGRQRYEALNVGAEPALEAQIVGAGDDPHLVRPLVSRPTTVAPGGTLAFSVLRVEGREVSVQVVHLLDGEQVRQELPVD